MTMLSELKPKKKERVCDLLERAGIKFRKNQNFLSKCAFNQDKIVVLNFWYGKQIEPQGENIIVKWRLPTTTKEASPRMRTVHEAIESAIEKNLKIRIIVLDGKMGNANTQSKVSKRALDRSIWHVTAHNKKTGDCILTRGAEIENAVDDISAPPEGNRFPDRARVIVQVIKRDNQVRAHAIKRAKGKCEYCNVQGFPTTTGGFYVEAHHIIALCDSGRDTVDNVIALCPQHHRQAHYGKDAESLESEFINILEKLNRKA